MKTAMRSVIWGTAAAAVALAAPHAQSLEDIPVEQRLQILAGNQQARPLMEVFGIATFAGADESCQLFDVGELRAFQVLKGQIGRQLVRVGGDEAVAAIDQSERGTRQATGCAMPDDTKVTIERARVVARALQDAPAAMTTDQQQCAVEGTHWRFHRREWEFVPKGHFVEYEDPQLEAMYQGLRTNFASIADQACGSVKQTVMLIPAFEKLRLMEEASSFAAPDAMALTSPGSSERTVTLDISAYGGRSVRGPGAGIQPNPTSTAWHTRGRENRLCELSSPGLFWRRGAHVLHHRGEVDRGYQPEHRSGRTPAWEWHQFAHGKVAGEKEGMEGTSTFELGKSGLTVLRDQGDARFGLRSSRLERNGGFSTLRARAAECSKSTWGRSGKVWRGRMRRAPRKTDAITGVSNCLGALSEGGRIPGAGAECGWTENPLYRRRCAHRDAGELAQSRGDDLPGKAMEPGLRLAGQDNFDVIILDRMLGDDDGLKILARLRESGVDTPILMLSALGRTSDRAEGLDAGADDYSQAFRSRRIDGPRERPPPACIGQGA